MCSASWACDWSECHIAVFADAVSSLGFIDAYTHTYFQLILAYRTQVTSYKFFKVQHKHVLAIML